MDKKVFVVVVTYNGAQWIDKCIGSLRESAYPVQTIVLDNASTDNTLQLLNNYSDVTLVETGANLGFGKANNIGIEKAMQAGADYIFLLNQDAWVFTDTIGKLVEKMERYPQLGIVSPMHYIADEATLDGNFKTYMERGEAFSADADVTIVPFVNAAAWMVSRECVGRVGYFEPLFVHYGEDRNYCDRVRYHNFSIGIDLESKIVHDRTITRNFKKDVIQSQYKLLTTLLDINKSYAACHLQVWKEIIGLPKYFSKHYGAAKAVQLLAKLKIYYAELLLKQGAILSARKKAKGNG